MSTHDTPTLDPQCAGAQQIQSQMERYRERGLDQRRLALLNHSLAVGHVRLCPRCQGHARNQDANARKETQMLAVSTEPAAVRLDPTIHATAEIPDLARRFLSLTENHAARVAWRSARADARTILRQCRKPGYLETPDAQWDLDYLLDLVSEVLPDCEDEPEEEVDDYGISDSDFFDFAGSRGR